MANANKATKSKAVKKTSKSPTNNEKSSTVVDKNEATVVTDTTTTTPTTESPVEQSVTVPESTTNGQTESSTKLQETSSANQSDNDDSKKSTTGSSSSDKSDSIENAFITKLNIFTSKVAAINREVRELQSIGKTLEKDFNQVIKVISKQKNKNKNSENRTLSGFAMPSLLSQELYDFLKIEEGTRIPRKDVTKMLNDYIKENKLRDDNDRRKILPDENLKRIFNCTEQDNVTYFNLQTYMKHHFIKDHKPLDRPISA